MSSKLSSKKKKTKIFLEKHSNFHKRPCKLLSFLALAPLAEFANVIGIIRGGGLKEDDTSHTFCSYIVLK